MSNNEEDCCFSLPFGYGLERVADEKGGEKLTERAGSIKGSIQKRMRMWFNPLEATGRYWIMRQYDAKPNMNDLDLFEVSKSVMVHLCFLSNP